MRTWGKVVGEMFGDSKQLAGVYTPLTVFIRIINNLPLGLSVSMTVNSLQILSNTAPMINVSIFPLRFPGHALKNHLCYLCAMNDGESSYILIFAWLTSWPGFVRLSLCLWENMLLLHSGASVPGVVQCLLAPQFTGREVNRPLATWRNTAEGKVSDRINVGICVF